MPSVQENNLGHILNQEPNQAPDDHKDALLPADAVNAVVVFGAVRREGPGAGEDNRKTVRDDRSHPEQPMGVGNPEERNTGARSEHGKKPGQGFGKVNHPETLRVGDAILEERGGPPSTKSRF